MDWTGYIGDLNWWAVIGATLSTFVVGAAWYSEGVLGAKWAKLVGMTVKEMNSGKGMTEVYVMTGLQSFIVATVMGALLLATKTTGWSDGLVFGLVTGFAYRFGTHVMHNGFAKKSKDLTWIDGAHDVLALGIVGGILGQWL